MNDGLRQAMHDEIGTGFRVVTRRVIFAVIGGVVATGATIVGVLLLLR